MSERLLKGKCSGMLMNDAAGKLYTANASMIQEFSYPEMERSAFARLEHGRMLLSPSGKYLLAASNPSGQVLLFDLDNQMQKMIRLKIPDIRFFRILFFDDTSFLMADKKSVFWVSLTCGAAALPEDDLRKLLGLSPRESMEIVSLDCYQARIIMLVHVLVDGVIRSVYTVMMENLDMRIAPQMNEIKENRWAYSEVRWDHQGGFILTSYDSVKYTLLHYAWIRNHWMAHGYRLPAIWYPSISNDGLYMTYTSNSSSAFLVSTNSWEIKREHSADFIFDASFSTDTKKWLVGSYRPYIADIS